MATLFPTQVPTKATGKAVEDALSPQALATHVGDWSSLLLVQTWARPGFCSDLESESEDGKPLALSSYLSVAFSNN